MSRANGPRLVATYETGDAAHAIYRRASPLYTLLSCSCGWTHQETRRQNALARASKERAAIRKHLDAVAATNA